MEDCWWPKRPGPALGRYVANQHHDVWGVSQPSVCTTQGFSRTYPAARMCPELNALKLKRPIPCSKPSGPTKRNPTTELNLLLDTSTARRDHTLPYPRPSEPAHTTKLATAPLYCLLDPVNVNTNQMPCLLIQTTHEDPCPVCTPSLFSRFCFCPCTSPDLLLCTQGKNAHCQPSTHAHLHAR